MYNKAVIYAELFIIEQFGCSDMNKQLSNALGFRRTIISTFPIKLTTS